MTSGFGRPELSIGAYADGAEWNAVEATRSGVISGNGVGDTDVREGLSGCGFKLRLVFKNSVDGLVLEVRNVRSHDD